MKRLVLAFGLAAGLLATPALAQYGGGYGGFGDRPDYSGPRSSGPPRPRDDDGLDRRGPRPDRYGRPDDRGGRTGRAAGGLCVTARGACPAGPAPQGARCGCEIPGFGTTRGIVR